MSATFACPHCGATYPVKPVLVGKPVRCTKCKNAFKLRPDGVADAIDGTAMAGASAQPPQAESRPAVAATPAEPPPPAKPAPEPPRPMAAAAPAERPRPALAVASPPAPETNAAAARAEAARKLNQKQEEARRAMAGTLASAAAEALKAEAVKREAVKDEKARKAPASAGKPTGGSQRIGPVLVVGEGEREARNARTWVLGTLAVIVLIAGLVALVSLRSAQRKALDAFAAPVEEQYARYPNRLPRMQSRAWLAGGPALVDVGHVKMGGKHRYELANARPVLAAIAKDQTFFQQYDLWAPTADSAKIAKSWSVKKDRDTNIQSLRDAGIAITTRAELEAKLREAGLGEEGAAVVMELLLPSQGSPQGAAQRVAKGELPDALEVASFRGSKGTALQDAGSTYKFPFLDYTGKVVRFVGEGWPPEWRVLAIRGGD